MPALRTLLVAFFAVLALIGAGEVDARASRVSKATATDAIARAELPPEAVRMLALIRAGGPWDEAKDNTAFGNREGLLPPRKRGYYREFTVRTPGVTHRGARRIVAGGEPPGPPHEFYYTDDHYRSFRRIEE